MLPDFALMYCLIYNFATDSIGPQVEVGLLNQDDRFITHIGSSSLIDVCLKLADSPDYLRLPS
jgi:hypothetical protein